MRLSGDIYPSLIVHVPGSILGIDNHLTLAADVAIWSIAIPNSSAAIMDPENLCFNIWTIYVLA